jgi:hypothetical protein
MPLSKSKCWFSSNCVHFKFLNHAVPLFYNICRRSGPNIRGGYYPYQVAEGDKNTEAYNTIGLHYQDKKYDSI